MLRLPAVSRAFDASFGRFVSTTEAAIVSGASVVSSSSGIRSFGDSDMMCEAVRSEREVKSMAGRRIYRVEEKTVECIAQSLAQTAPK
jgi:hypothetical protein